MMKILKLLSLAKYLPGFMLLAISYLFKRNKRKWIFGNIFGFADNSKYLFIRLCEENFSDITCVWISNSLKENDYVRQLGFKSYTKWSLGGLYHSLTAKVFFYSQGITDVNRWTVGSGIQVNLWHGLPIKNVGLESKVGKHSIKNQNNPFVKFYLKMNSMTPDIMLSTSAVITNYFSKSFNLPVNRFIEALYPRCEILLWSEEKRFKFIMKYEDNDVQSLIKSLSHYNKTYIYMPTLRDSERNFIVESGIDFILMDKILREKNNILLVKLHPVTKLPIDIFNNLSNIVLVKNINDIYPILSYTDVLITDYSSIYYDYLLLKKSIISFPFDYNKYVSEDRDLAFDFDKYTPGRKVMNFEQLLDAIKNDEKTYYRDERSDLLSFFWGNANQQLTLTYLSQKFLMLKKQYE